MIEGSLPNTVSEVPASHAWYITEAPDASLNAQFILVTFFKNVLLPTTVIIPFLNIPDSEAITILSMKESTCWISALHPAEGAQQPP